MSLLILGLALFLGAHSVRIVADDWRGAQLARLGAARWKGLFTLVSLVGFGLIVYGFGLARAETAALWLPPAWTRPLTALLMMPAFILLVAAYLPGSHIKAAVGHPMVASFALWALAHLLAAGKLSAMTLFGAFLVWTIADFVSARRRDRAARRTYAVLGWPRDAAVAAIGLAAWALFALYGHVWLIGARSLG